MATLKKDITGLSPSEILGEIKLGYTIIMPLDQLYSVLSAAGVEEVLQLLIVVTKGNAYLQINKSYQQN